MKALVVIHNLTDRNAHLMPWRTACEVVERGCQKGHDFRLISLGDRTGFIDGQGIPSGTLSVSKDDDLERGLCEFVNEWGGDVILWPVTWREPYRRIKVVGHLGVPIVGYFPGGVYQLTDALYAVKRIGWRKALPYLADAVWPKWVQLARWREHGFCHLITMTAFTANAAVENGWPKNLISVIPPGRDSQEEHFVGAAVPGAFQTWRRNRPFYMFAGPPSGIRGIYELLKAFDRMADNHKNICLVCLFRSDGLLESAHIAKAINGMVNRERVYCIWESLSRAQLEAFMSECYATVLPFIAVPSEIPLAIIEAMRYEKPVITTMTGGSGDFVRGFGDAVLLGDIGALADSMSRLLVDSNYYRDRCLATREAYASHPTWDTMADQWVECISNALKPFTRIEWGTGS
jgi:glycosyltransferase involved in cell wall biosynthesis